MNEHSKERFFLSLKDWLQEEISIRIEAIKIVHSIKSDDPDQTYRKQYPSKSGRKNRPNSFLTATGNRESSERYGNNKSIQKPPCTFCNSPYHGILSCREFEQKSVDERQNIAKEKQLYFRCSSKDHREKTIQGPSHAR